MKCPHQCQVKPVRVGQVVVIEAAEGGADTLCVVFYLMDIQYWTVQGP